MKTRNSRIEAIKIFAVALIVLCHAVPDVLTFPDGEIYTSTAAVKGAVFFTVDLFAGAGLIGDVIFIVCSSYYLLESNRVRPSKIFSMILNAWVISMVFLAIILALGYRPDAYTIVRQFFPTIFQNNWFISYYIVFYLIHPLLNKVIYSLGKTALGIAAALLSVHCFILLYIQGAAPGINKLICFAAIYFDVAYLKLYAATFMKSKKTNVILCSVSAAVYFILRVTINMLGQKYSYFENVLAFVHINCPVILVFAISLFNLANLGTGENKVINYVSSLSLLIYIITRNNLFAEYIQPLYFQSAATCGTAYFIPFILLLAVIYFFGGILEASLYRFTVERGIKAVSAKAETAVLGLIDKIKTKNTEKENPC